MLRRTILPILFVTILVGSSTRAESVPSVPHEAPAFIDDDAVVAKLDAEAGALMAAGKAPKLKALRAQLQKVKHCTLDVPPPDLTALAPAELFAKRAPGVLVV